MNKTFYEVAEAIKNNPKTRVEYSEEFDENRYYLSVDSYRRNARFEEGFNESMSLYPHIYSVWNVDDDHEYICDWYLNKRPKVRIENKYGAIENLDYSREEAKDLVLATIDPTQNDCGKRMTLTEEVYMDKIPEMAQRFIDYVEAHPDDYRIMVKANVGLNYFVYKKHDGGNQVFRYIVSNDYGDHGMYKELAFFLEEDGYHYFCCMTSSKNLLEIIYPPSGSPTVFEKNKVVGELNCSVKNFTNIFEAFLKQQ